MSMAEIQVSIVDFPETKVAVFEYIGSPKLEHEAVARFVAWRKLNGLPPSALHRSYGVYYNDPRSAPVGEYRVDLCVSVSEDVPANEMGVLNKIIPARRCAVARHIGSRDNVVAAAYLYEQWLPQSGEQQSDFPLFFHYVNVGPHIAVQDMLTDVYLPLR